MLKNLNGRENREKKEKIAEICFKRSFPRELSKIKPVLIVCASSIALKLLLKRKYRDSLKTLLEIVGKEDRLPTVEDLIGESEPTISELKYLRKCKVAIFPNPSPVAGKWKKEYYQVERNRTKKVLEKVHFIVETNLLP
ncbi:MAG: hypothetical protein J7L38_03060 [Thermoproteales archaeon]|nr:hypothetical protein [Thermoproteales archaeon]